MTESQTIALFEQKEIRKIWHNEEWYFILEDVVFSLTNSINRIIKRMGTI